MKILLNVCTAAVLSVSLPAFEVRARAQGSEGTHVVLTPEKPVYRVGESVLVRYRLENTGSKPIPVTLCDTNGFLGQFRVSAVDSDGKAVPAAEGFFSFGGFSQIRQIKPGESFSVVLPAARFVRFEYPGVYRLQIEHTLGSDSDKSHPQIYAVGETTVRLEMPNRAQAQALLNYLFKQPNIERAAYDPEAGPAPYFDLLRHPLYLPLLIPYAKRGSFQALAGIHSIDIPEATKALIHLIRVGPDMAQTIGFYLRNRLPDPYASYNLPGPGNPETPLSIAQRRFRERAWRPDVAKAVRAYARNALMLDTYQSDNTISFMIASVGEKQDLPRLAAAIDRAIVKLGRAQEEDQKKSLKWAPASLRYAAVGLFERGILPAPSPLTPGEAEIFIEALERKRTFRPYGWETVLAKLLSDRTPLLRESALIALRLLPAPLPDRLSRAALTTLPGLVHDPDPDVRRAAIGAIRPLKARDLAGEALAQLKSSRDENLLRTAFGSAYQVGAGADAISIIAGRLSEKDLTMPIMGLLTSIVSGAPSWGFDSNLEPEDLSRLKSNWLRFAAEQRERIDSGRLFTVGDPALTPEIYPGRYFSFHLADGSTWPPRPEK